MGNQTSSCFLVNTTSKAKLVDGKGNFRRVRVPIKAAEVMLEEPGHVISPVDELQKSQRISALRADDQLLASKVYLLVPVCRINGKITRDEIAMIETACDRKSSLKRRKRSSVKVLPSVNDQEVRLEKDGDQATALGGNIHTAGFTSQRLGKHRQWIPVLEAISEVY